MKDGFIKTAAASCDIRVADCEYNAKNIIKTIDKCAKEGVKLLTFPELCITGYTCGDLFFQKTLQKGAEQALAKIAASTAGTDMLTAVGAPICHNMKIYNCAVMISNGRILGVVPKTNIPNYNEFYEYRHFSPAPDENSEVTINGEAYPFGTKLIFSCVSMPEFKVGAEICEDLWVPVTPSSSHCAAGATIIVNLSASDEVIGKADYRRMLVMSHSARLICGYVYADAGYGESTTDMVFSGHNLIAENGSVLAERKMFENGITISEIDVGKISAERCKTTTYPPACENGYKYIEFDAKTADTFLTRRIAKRPFVPEDEKARYKRCEDILTIQSMGLVKRLEHSHAKTAVVGISGGLDSCLALLVIDRAMKIAKRSPKQIIAVTMPCFGTTKRTKSNAEVLCETLGVTLETIDIAEAVNLHFRDIGHSGDNYDVVYENSQARERTQILMDIANREGGMVIGTGDLSELALGWATYNGDHMSMYGVNASIPKTLVRHIVRYAADSSEDNKLKEVLLDILDTPVSPELLPVDDKGEIAQKTEDIVGPYDLHDFFLYYIIRFGFSPSKIYRLCVYAFNGEYDKATILKWMKIFYRRFFAQQFKRSCLPDGPKVGTVTLSPRGDWRMPSDACAALWLKEAESLTDK